MGSGWTREEVTALSRKFHTHMKRGPEQEGGEEPIADEALSNMEVPANLVEHALELIQRHLQNLGIVRGISLEVREAFFNAELQPLRERIAVLENGDQDAANKALRAHHGLRLTLETYEEQAQTLLGPIIPEYEGLTSALESVSELWGIRALISRKSKRTMRTPRKLWNRLKRKQM
jgi:hypothetical protein